VPPVTVPEIVEAMPGPDPQSKLCPARPAPRCSAGYQIELYSSTTCSGARILLDSFEVTTDGAGATTFSRTVPAEVTPGHYITASAIDPAGLTSDICSCVAVQYLDPDINANGFESGNTSQWSATTRRLQICASRCRPHGPSAISALTPLPSILTSGFGRDPTFQLAPAEKRGRRPGCSSIF
jgi:hypothetical protein